MQVSRRVVTVILTLGLIVAPLAAEAQPAGKVYKIGFMAGGAPATSRQMVEAFRQGLRDVGYVEGQNLVIEYRWAEGKYERHERFAAELVRLQVDVIVTSHTPAAIAAKKPTTTVPIVMAVSADPIGAGVVASLARPGGNVTGHTIRGCRRPSGGSSPPAGPAARAPCAFPGPGSRGAGVQKHVWSANGTLATHACSPTRVGITL